MWKVPGKAKLLAAKDGYKLHRAPKNYDDVMEVECPHGHRYTVKYKTFMRGARCRVCCDKRKSITSFKRMRVRVAEYGMILPEQPHCHSRRDEVELICPLRGKIRTTLHNLNVRLSYKSLALRLLKESKEFESARKKAMSIVKRDKSLRQQLAKFKAGGRSLG
jgi:hypothetical protein